MIECVTELPDLAPMLEASLAEGHGLLQRMINEWNSGANRFDRPGEAVFVARDDDRHIVGICGLNIDPYLNDASVGRVRHLYVLPSHRRLGIGRELVTAVIEAARPHFRLLRLRTRNPVANALYRSIGFVVSAGDALATHVMEMRPHSLR